MHQLCMGQEQLTIMLCFLILINILGTVAEELTRFELYEKSLGNGESLRIHEEITSSSICSRHCLAENWCHGFHHDSLNVMCHLYGSCISHYGNKTMFSKASLDTTKNNFLAQGKPASISSQFASDKGASHGNNGVYPTSDTDLFHTNQDVNPWWKVDLEESHCVWAVYFMNRGYGSWGRARNIMVTVSEMESEIMDNGDNRCGYIDGAAEQFDNLVVCSVPMVGRYVQLQMMAIDFLHLYEVEVHGY